MGERRIVLLINCGASNNFKAINLVQELNDTIAMTTTYQVKVGDGHKI